MKDRLLKYSVDGLVGGPKRAAYLSIAVIVCWLVAALISWAEQGSYQTPLMFLALALFSGVVGLTSWRKYKAEQNRETPDA